MSHGDEHLPNFVSDFWRKIPPRIRFTIEDNFLPENVRERPVPGEVVQVEIGIAWYRNIVGILVFYNLIATAVVMVVTIIAVAIYALMTNQSLSIIWIPILLCIAIFGYAIYQEIEHRQWRLVKTNARFIISLPQPGSFLLVDNIELKGTPSVLDTNWSPNPIWRTFQFFTGARDLYLSLSGYQFAAGSARVRDALVIPDVMQKDVQALKEEIFKKWKPSAMRFIDAQPVYIMDAPPPDDE
ncbi:MAG TPA: hypothetical protein VLL52_02105 [Anaerolineae bacterium]|nr:hypothetical protein [Anaerolineae bacterium]